ncbi:hypothetical protein BKA66DRAFT_405445 [Pyrenochaeta sp. MPI-SDFR-AT-0127]|nr:hypothetical protein BKA66DRAFT_405445 [Pyrenochaeta sp. MPI-SDFR-AT-0127]
MSRHCHGHGPGISDVKREREVLLFYGASFQSIPSLNEQGPRAANHVAHPSPDSTLTALGQLTAVRLGAQRAMISLIDDRQQHVLAEATCNLSLRSKTTVDVNDALLLGNVSIPRTWGVCESVLDLDSGESAVIINDLTQNDDTAHRVIVRDFPEMRFYAGAPLLSSSGATLGTVCIFDDRPRNGLSETDLNLFKDLAATIVDYLHTYALRERHQRGERFTRGLVSFSEGASALMPFTSDEFPDTAVPLELSSDMSSTTEPDGTTELDTATGTEATTDPEGTPRFRANAGRGQQIHQPQELQHRLASVVSKSTRAKSAQHRSIRSLQDSILPSHSRSMFSRAANIMMASSTLDGVLILDASVAANGQRRSSPGPGNGAEHQSESYSSRSSSSDEGNTIGNPHRGTSSSSSKMCQVLGIATRDGGSQHGALLEPDLVRLFTAYSRGKIFTFTAEGTSLSSTEEQSSNSNADAPDETARKAPPPPLRQKKPSIQALRSAETLQNIFPGARSIAFVPFWDYERSRWFAGCLCWSNSPYRMLSPTVDLPYYKVFSHSIMRELSRLDAMALNQAKTTFVASISHELRSPLHGILGTLEFIKDTKLDSFQVSMLNSLNACGQTLLDTINHVMDHAKISEATRNVSSRRLKNSNTVRLSSKPLRNRRIKDKAFDLGIITEEVVEAVFSGSSYVPIPVASASANPPETPSYEAVDPLTKRKICFIVLDLAIEQDWIYCFPVGSWRRIVMNIFGNAVKYTKSGFIQVSLRASDSKSTESTTTATLTITDSGSGMSPEFLANRAFQAFSQEDPHAVGTGLGLSIIRQIIETNGGKIEISSGPTGTKLIVKLALNRPEPQNQTTSSPHSQFLAFLPRLEGRRICVLHKKVALRSNSSEVVSRIDEGLIKFIDALVATLENRLKMQVVQTTEWEGHDAELVVCPEVSFEYLHSIRRKRSKNSRAPVTVFVAMDALEASSLRADARVLNKQSVVEIMTQPCGPYKLAFILNRCLDRFDLPEENLRRPDSNSQSPQALPWRPKPLPQTFLSLNSVRATEPSALDPKTSSTTATTPAASMVTATTNTDPAVAPHEAMSSGSTRILVADDNSINRRLLAAFLNKHNIPYQEASNGLEAFNAYKDDALRFKVILMDMSMPVMDGMTATRAIREYERSRKLPRCCIIALTGLASASAKLEAWNSGIDHFMTKPIHFRKLEEFLKNGEVKRLVDQQRRKSVTGIGEEASGAALQNEPLP